MRHASDHPSAVMFEIAGAQAGHFLVDERPEEAVALTNRMIPFAELAGFSIPRAQLLSYRGSARVDLGDYNGIADMEESARILARHADPATAKTYGNLADSARSLGDMAGADNAYEAAARWAQRFALRQIADWITIEQAYQAYHAADWRTAEDLLDEVQTTGVMIQNGIRITRCRISLARGDLTGALEDAGRFAVFAETGSGEDLSHALVLRALCDAARDRQAEALASCQQLLARGQDSHGMAHRSIELCDIAPILANAARHSEIREVADRLPETNRWRDALRAVADERYAAAAALYEHIGSQPLAADAHLLAARQAAQEGRHRRHPSSRRSRPKLRRDTGATLYEERAGRTIRSGERPTMYSGAVLRTVGGRG